MFMFGCCLSCLLCPLACVDTENELSQLTLEFTSLVIANFAVKRETMDNITCLVRPNLEVSSAKEHKKAGLDNISDEQRILLKEACDRSGFIWSHSTCLQ